MSAVNVRVANTCPADVTTRGEPALKLQEHSCRVVVESTAPPDIVFSVLENATSWHEWVGAIRTSSYERHGDPAPHGVGAMRKFGLPFGQSSREEIVEYVSPNILGYQIVSGSVPVHNYSGRVDVAQSSEGSTIAWTVTFQSKVPGIGATIRYMIGRTAAGLARESERQLQLLAASGGDES